MVESNTNKAQQLLELNMKSLSTSQQTHILSLLESGQSAHQISSSTGVHTSTISRLRRKHHPYLSKPSGGRPSKLSLSNIRYGQRLISASKVENAVQVTKALKDIINQPKTTRRYLKQHG